jgi:hypothetical protein
MNMKELNDEEILQYLMTSDLNENFKPEEYKFLIFKFRDFYKLIHGKFNLYKLESEKVIKDLDHLNKSIENQISNFEVQKNLAINELEAIPKQRKLTFKERITGKITIRQ